MRAENYISFFTVCGFFLGLICAIFKFDDSFMIISFTLVSTFVFYILIHIIIINFVDAKKLGCKSFDKQLYEITTNYIISELDKREAKMGRIIDSVENELQLVQKPMRKARKNNAKAA